MSHFSDRDYKAYFQNWSIVQDARGILYAGNRDGLLRFDGADWSLIKTHKKTTVRSLAVSSDDKLYLGEMGDFGYLVADSLGSERFVSLLSKVPLEHQTFNDVWTTVAIGRTIYFQTSTKIFRWDGRSMQVWISERGFHTSFVFGGELYVRERQVGLKKLVNDEFVLIENGEMFSESKIYGLLPFGSDGSFLVATREDGLFVFSGNDVVKLDDEIEEYLNINRLYCSAKLGNDLFAFGTLRGGIVITDKTGKIVYHIGQPIITDDVIRYLYTDLEDGLWVATSSDGLFRIQLPFALSKYTREEGIHGDINSISRVNGAITVGTLTGSFSMSRTAAHTFERLAEIPNTWEITSIGKIGFAATEEGTFLLTPRKSIRIDNRQSFSVKSIGAEARYILSGGGNNLWLFEETVDNSYKFKSELTFQPLIRSIVPIGRDVWLGTRADGVIRLTFSEGEGAVEKNEAFSEVQGLPSNTSIDITSVNSEPVFYSTYGPYRFVEEQEQFELAHDLWPFSENEGDSLLAMTEDPHGNVWMVFPDSVVKASPQIDGKYEFEVPPILKFKKTSSSSIMVEDDEVVWFNDGDELVRYDSNFDSFEETEYNAIVSQVAINGHSKAIHNGSYSSSQGGMSLSQPKWSIPNLSFDQKDLRIKVSATAYKSPEDIRFQTRIDARDTDWQEWTEREDYLITGLSEGTYTFRVRAKNAAGRLSREAKYTFVILPPWYRTWWAYLSYLALGCLLIYSGRKYYVMVRAHKLAAEQAEELAREREVNKVLQEANERLTKANRLKDEFLATTSHELRTPLTAILGFTSVLREEIPEDADYREFLDIIEDSGSRLMETLNSLLDLAKLRAGMMEINLETCDLYYQCSNAISSMQSAANRKGLELYVERPSETIFVELDVVGFLRILQNLVGNAIKFTERGHVKIVLEAEKDLVHLKVCDTGIGIDDEFLPRLFDEFMQESDGPSRSYEGFGLGLAITARLVQLMRGGIYVESKKGEGSQFIVTLPRTETVIGEPIAVRGFGGVEKSS